MKLVSWNVNGLRAVMGKGFFDFFHQADAELFALQETKMQQGQAEVLTPGYHQFWSSAEKKGYSGTLVFSKKEPLSVHYGIDGKYSDEGRLITLEFDGFYFVTSYTPNAQNELRRLPYRMEYEDDLRCYLSALKEKKGVILCGDLNVAHQETDLKNPKANVGNPGFSDEEREKFSLLLEAGFTDTFRHLYPDARDAYSWWSYRMRARERNVGWRIDYFVTSRDLDPLLRDARIRSEVLGSDHCPVELILDEPK
ncbi:MAG: exodeoxyribonuclease III [Clostridia bacterium]|nr:exodeoxyribonuclease III [Clostridia bacterium]